jgi:leucyl aminopeptidase (aminopeptidase T)
MRPLIDPRAEKLAHILVDHSMEIVEGDVLMLRYEDAFCRFANYVAELAQKKGAETICGDVYSLSERVEMIKRSDHAELKD